MEYIHRHNGREIIEQTSIITIIELNLNVYNEQFQNIEDYKMDEILFGRLTTFSNKIEVLANEAKDLCICQPWDKKTRERSLITVSRLQAALTSFNSNLHHYFNKVEHPDADGISLLTNSQIEGEEALADLNAQLQMNKNEESSEVSTCMTNRSKLPELTLVKFQGDILNWYPFWDQFNSNIGQRRLSEVDKLLYLKASLQGEARNMIEGLKTTNENYQIAVDTLQARYGRKEQVVDAHYAALHKVKPSIKREECRKTFDEIERHLRVLKSLGEDTDSNHLRFLIMEKFPEDVIYEVRLKTGTGSIENLRRELDTIISAREDAKGFSERVSSKEMKYTTEALHINEVRHKRKFVKPKLQSNKRGKFHRNCTPNTSTTAFAGAIRKRYHESRLDGSTQATGLKRRKMQCIFCQGEHFNDKCRNFKTIFERKKKLGDSCYKCFQKGHRGNTCRKDTVCVYCQSRFHNRALCPKTMVESKAVKPESVQTLHTHGESFTILQTAIVYIKDQTDTLRKYRLLLDSGSQRSYISKKVATELNLEAEEENQLLIFTFGSKKPQEIRSPLVKLNLVTRINKTKIIYANVVSSITEGIACPTRKWLEQKREDKYVMADDGSLSDQVDILIGNDYYYALMSTEKIRLKENLYLINSEFGWILSGRTEEVRDDELKVLTYFQSSYETKLNNPDLPLDMGNVKNLWDLETIGITDSPKIDQEEEAIKRFNETTTVKENRCCVSWPWTEYPPNLPANLGLAYGRLVSLLKRLDKDTLNDYDKTIKSQLDKEVIEPVLEEGRCDHPVHYLAHHGVSTPGKPLRIVFDASARVGDNKSLNQCLYSGPILLEELTGILIRFRSYKIGITADVEKAFLQMALYEKDRDVTRFLWVKDITKAINEDNLQHFRFKRVPFGIISSPFLLNATIKLHLSNSTSDSVRKLANDIYVDNLVTGTNDIQSAKTLYKDTKLAFQQISMNMREWSSNSEELMQYIEDKNTEENVKVLGLNWNVKRDTLQLKWKEVHNAHTKRGILKTVASIYDPCGYAAPVIVSAKLLFQSLWKEKYQWDTPLPEDIVNQWKTILKDFELVRDICLPRNMSQHTSCQLHCFTDSSTKAYAAVVYLVQEDNVQFVIGKTRLAPVKDQENLKIPRLELLSVLIGNRLLQYVEKYIDVNVRQQFLWTDSQIVISWYHSNKLLTPFVARRIEEIKRNKALVIRHVPSEFNAADVATRPLKVKQDLNKWLNGPTFLRLDSKRWPDSLASSTSCVAREGLLPNDGTLQSKPHSEEELSDNLRNNEQIENTGNLRQVNFQNEDVTRSNENMKITSETQELVKLQKCHFPDEVRGKETNLTRNLGVFKDVDGVLRCEGRLTHSDLSYDAKHPILLPKDCDYSNEIIKNIHEGNYHVGVPHTLSLIRQKYWIPQGRAQVQKIIGKCPQCKRHGGGPYTLPSTPALPTERVKYDKSFAYVGIDYFGPMLVRSENGKEKRWISLFTCLVIRAIHLEVVKDMSTEECSLAFRRFIASKGIPELILSDNALQFRLLSEILTAKGVAEKEIKWKFIPQLAPWHGGVYERLVAVVKHCLKRTLQKHLVGNDQLLTIIKEVESVVNTRPLTYVSGDLDHILKPADFLTPGKCIDYLSIMENITSSTTSTKQQLVEAWKRGEIIIGEYRDMFINQYLLSLRERYKHSPKQPRVKTHDEPRVGDIVQIRGEVKNRNNWKVGRISELLHGSDGQCRVAKVKVGDVTFTRSIAHLYPLETDDTVVTEDNVCPKTREPGVISEDSDINISLPVEEIVHASNEEVNDSNNLNLLKEMEVTELSQEEVDINAQEENNLMKDINEDIETHDSNLNNLPNEESKEKRVAAVQAMKKIKEWTRHLMTTLSIQC